MQRDQPRAFPTILVVEDDELVRATAVALLDTQGYDVLEAATAEAALQLLSTEPNIRLLFTDVHFPGVNCGLNLAAMCTSAGPISRFSSPRGGTT